MKKSKNLFLFFVLLVAIPTLVSCQPNYAEYTGGEVTQEEVDKLASSRIERLKQQIENVKKRAGEQVLFRELLDKEAGSQGIQKYFSDFVAKQRNEIPDHIIVLYMQVNGLSQGQKPSQETIHKYKSRFASNQMELYRDLLFLELKRKYKAKINQKDDTGLGPKKEINIQGLPAQGPESAPITIVSFTDFQCPYCKKSFFTMEALKKIFKDKIRYVYADFPLHFHKYGKYASLGARCAGDQGKFWEYHDALFYINKITSDKPLFQIASVLGINNAQFQKCYQSKKYWNEINKFIQYGNSLGVQGTPAFFINGHFVSGALPLTEFVAILESLGAKP